MGGTKHLKRRPAPNFWPIHRKEYRWVVKPGAGPHRAAASLPLLVILRDMLNVARTRREVDVILEGANVKVDGVVRKRDDYPVGLMDVLEIPALNKVYRVLPQLGKGLRLHSIKPDEKGFKLCKIVNKTTVAGGNIQLNLHDGRNHIVQVVDPKKPTEDVYKANDLLKVGLLSQEVLGHLAFEPGVIALVERGRNVGRWGEVVRVSNPSFYGATAVLADSNGEEFETVVDYLFPIGKGEPWITLPAEDEKA
jgi:small subunit ribosomal protein S4e